MLQSLFEKLRNIPLHLTFLTRRARVVPTPMPVSRPKTAKAHPNRAGGP
jgi:hypothetical protein